ncbi:hypothetical protein BU17DRAFT_67093 [Hysterangium stoloniferum]|nr:hypothetical protein BU17DRAFT_67093 [Hysterangium stoloniferum]
MTQGPPITTPQCPGAIPAPPAVAAPPPKPVCCGHGGPVLCPLWSQAGWWHCVLCATWWGWDDVAGGGIMALAWQGEEAMQLDTHAQLHAHMLYTLHLFPMPLQHAHVHHPQNTLHHPQNTQHHSHNLFASLLVVGVASAGGGGAGGIGGSAGVGAGGLEMCWPVHGGQDRSPYNASPRRQQVMARLSVWCPVGCIWQWSQVEAVGTVGGIAMWAGTWACC